MNIRVQHYLLIIKVFKYVALLVGLLVLLRALPAKFWAKCLIALTLSVLISHLYLISHLAWFGFDFQIFLRVGRDVRAGIDPYSPERFAELPFLNPPPALPLFALFDAMPMRVSLGLWTVLNIASTLGLVVLARYSLIAQSQIESGAEHERSGLRKLGDVQIAGLAVCLLFSDSSLRGLYLGQLNVFVAFMVLLALVAQGRARPSWAGIYLSLATVKFVTMIPFLMLFLRRSDRWTWAALIASLLGLCALTGRLSELPSRLAILAHGAEELAAPGKVNDYSYEGTQNENIISFEHLFYRIGMRDRRWIRYSQFLALLAVGGWVAHRVLLGNMPRPAAASLVSLFSLLFLYHRDYDTVILALPLVYCAGRVSVTTSRLRRLYATCGALVLAVLFMNVPYLNFLTRLSVHRGGWGRLVQLTVLPYPTWLILLAMFLLIWATRLDRAPSTGVSEWEGDT